MNRQADAQADTPSLRIALMSPEAERRKKHPACKLSLLAEIGKRDGSGEK